MLKKLMALPYLPANVISWKFNQMKNELVDRELLVDFLHYYENTFITNKTWTPESWSIFKLIIRTNNHLESWHSRLNNNCGRNTTFYNLLKELEREANLTEVYKKLLSERKLCQIQKEKFKKFQEKIFVLWEKYDFNEITTEDLLVEVCNMNV